MPPTPSLIERRAMHPNLLEITDLKTHFFTEGGVVPAVDGVSLSIKRGGTLGVLGESGCGKSVTGFSILRLVRPPGRIVGGAIHYFGRETVNGEDLTALDARSEALRQVRGAEIAMIFQEPMTSLDPLFTVGNQIMEAILYHQDVSKAEARKIAVEMLDKVRMPQPADVIKQYPHQLSGGMRQRVMIAMALSCEPQLLIADEPTTALDVTTEAQILELMRELQDELGMAIMFITHDLGVIAEMAEEVAVMYLGKVVEQSDIQSLFADPQHPYTRALMQSIPKVGQKSSGRLEAIRGMVPSPRRIPSGCPFHPRCANFIADLCNVKTPQLKKTRAGHSVSCFLYDDGGSSNGA
ncbi:MAG: ABC transporter ATP-binding protein [Chloroflexi bacterium]|nr:ABC transporter ATP-binding protein [Chloroflexota bacterium]